MFPVGILYKGDSIWKRPKPVATISRIWSPPGLVDSYWWKKIFPRRILKKNDAFVRREGLKFWKYKWPYYD